MPLPKIAKERPELYQARTKDRKSENIIKGGKKKPKWAADKMRLKFKRAM
jgi:hypothetical protein